MTFAIAALATWRISIFMVRDAGPFRIFDTLRGKVVMSRNTTLMGVFSCVGCVSVYIGLAMAALWLIPQEMDALTVALTGLALSAVTMFCEVVFQLIKRINP